MELYVIYGRERSDYSTDIWANDPPGRNAAETYLEECTEHARPRRIKSFLPGGEMQNNKNLAATGRGGGGNCVSGPNKGTIRERRKTQGAMCSGRTGRRHHMQRGPRQNTGRQTDKKEWTQKQPLWQSWWSE
ncbi:hypothetical protein J6590_004207 [Homalodisca vitripennis]|nr:hypothetical protein J6590_004207 [Homalodisca vitripennis]